MPEGVRREGQRSRSRSPSAISMSLGLPRSGRRPGIGCGRSGRWAGSPHPGRSPGAGCPAPGCRRRRVQPWLLLRSSGLAVAAARSRRGALDQPGPVRSDAPDQRLGLIDPAAGRRRAVADPDENLDQLAAGQLTPGQGGGESPIAVRGHGAGRCAPQAVGDGGPGGQEGAGELVLRQRVTGSESSGSVDGGDQAGQGEGADGGQHPNGDQGCSPLSGRYPRCGRVWGWR